MSGVPPRPPASMAAAGRPHQANGQQQEGPSGPPPPKHETYRAPDVPRRM